MAPGCKMQPFSIWRNTAEVWNTCSWEVAGPRLVKSHGKHVHFGMIITVSLRTQQWNMNNWTSSQVIVTGFHRSGNIDREFSRKPTMFDSQRIPYGHLTSSFLLFWNGHFSLQTDPFSWNRHEVIIAWCLKSIKPSHELPKNVRLPIEIPYKSYSHPIISHDPISVHCISPCHWIHEIQHQIPIDSALICKGPSRRPGVPTNQITSRN